MEAYLKPYQVLLQKAIIDLAAAKNLYVAFDRGDTELDLSVIFFHLQQCTEKLLKAMPDYKKIEFPKWTVGEGH